jgi:Anaerobic dehydrogenases, typically selenocysteine-containing
MSRVTRRVFLKASALLGVTLAIGKYMSAKTLRFTDFVNTAHASQGKAKEVIPVVSDVDAHSQCMMRVSVQGGKVTAVAGDPTDPESKGQLTVRGKHMKEILYAPDRLKYPMKRAGARGEGKWQRISWDEALTNIANGLKEVKMQYGAEAIDFHQGHYHSGDILGSYLARLANLIGTPNITNPSHVCHLPRVFLEFNYDLGAVVPPDVAHTECLIIWGGNPEATTGITSLALHSQLRKGHTTKKDISMLRKRFLSPITLKRSARVMC